MGSRKLLDGGTFSLLILWAAIFASVVFLQSLPSHICTSENPATSCDFARLLHMPFFSFTSSAILLGRYIHFWIRREGYWYKLCAEIPGMVTLNIMRRKYHLTYFVFYPNPWKEKRAFKYNPTQYEQGSSIAKPTRQSKPEIFYCGVDIRHSHKASTLTSRR